MTSALLPYGEEAGQYLALILNVPLFSRVRVYAAIFFLVEEESIQGTRLS